jgi:hypothetical protein
MQKQEKQNAKFIIDNRISFLNGMKIGYDCFPKEKVQKAIEVIDLEINWLNNLINEIIGVSVIHNTETGEELYSVVYNLDLEDWIDSFYTIEESIDFINKNNYTLTKFKTTV